MGIAGLLYGSILLAGFVPTTSQAAHAYSHIDVHERTVAAACSQSSNAILCHPDCGVNLWKLIIHWNSFSIFLLECYPFFTFHTSSSVQFHHFI